MRHFLVGSLIVFATVGQATAQPAEVIIIRHAEKPPEGSELSLQGRERAAALVPYFLETPELLDFKTPVAIYAQAPRKDGSSVRSFETVKPLADALKLSVNQKYTRDDFRKMVAEIMAEEQCQGHAVLICREHKVISDIAEEFGVEDAPEWHSKQFDRTWVIKLRPGRSPRFEDLPQRLLYGDKDK